MVRKLDVLHNVEKIADQPLNCADRFATLQATHIGDMWVEVKSRFDDEPHFIELKQVLFVPKLTCDLLSEERITRSEKFAITFYHEYADVFDLESGEVLFSAERRNGMKYVDYASYKPNTDVPKAMATNSQPIQDGSTPSSSTAAASTTDENTPAETPVSKNDQLLEIWHRRLGHLSCKYIRRLQSQAVGIQNLKFNDDKLRDCRVCITSKMTRLPHNSTRERPTRKFELIHSDILDPSMISKNGKRYILTFICGFSGYLRTYAIEKKSEVGLYFFRFHKWLTNRFPDCPTSKLRVDNAREYVMGDLQAYCDHAGIVIDSGAPYSPELNGVSERKNRTILQMSRALLQESGLDTRFWIYSLKVSEYLINRSPTKSNAEFITPFEIVFDRKPDLSNLRVFGCIAMAHRPKEVRKQDDTQGKTTGQIKLGPVADVKFLVGYTDTGYELLDPESEKVTISRDIHFIESETYGTWIQKNLNPDTTPSQSTLRANTVFCTTVNDDPTDESSDEEFLEEHTEARAMLAMSKNKFRSSVPSVADFVPKTYSQAVNCPAKEAWIAAINREFDSHVENGTFKVVDMPRNSNLIDTKWVFRVKFDENGDEVAKARLTARGFKDQNEYSNSDKYSPVCPVDILRTVLSIANVYDMDLCSVDVTTAFLYGELSEEVFVRIPKERYMVLRWPRKNGMKP